VTYCHEDHCGTALSQVMRAVMDYVETVCEQILHPTQHPRGWLAAGPWINDAVEYGAHLGALDFPVARCYC